MEDLAGPHAVPMRIPRPKRNNSRRQQTAAAEQQQTVAATARPVAARWKHKAAAAQRGRWRRGGNGGNTCEIRGPRPYGQGLRFRVASGGGAQQQQLKSAAATTATAARQGKRDKYRYEVECVTDVPIGCILNR